MCDAANLQPSQFLGKQTSEPTLQYAASDTAQALHEMRVLAQSTSHLAAQQSCLQVEHLSINGEDTRDDVV